MWDLDYEAEAQAEEKFINLENKEDKIMMKNKKVIPITYEVNLGNKLILETDSFDEANEEAIELKLNYLNTGTPVIVHERENNYFNVTVYEVYRAFGGREEGGWWYDKSTPTQETYFFKTEEHAKLFADALNDSFLGKKAPRKSGYGSDDGVDENGYGDDDYLCTGGEWGEGKYRAIVNKADNTPCIPEQAPVYE